MANVRFLRGTALGGVGNDAAPGDVRDLPDAIAAVLVANGRAVFIEATTPAAENKPLPRQRRLKD